MAAPHVGMTELINGNFQDAEGVALADGYIVMALNQDAQTSQQSQLVAGRTVQITLDSNGNAVTGQYVWPNTALNPTSTFYIVNVYSAAGQLVWGPNYMLVNTTPTFDLDTWVPNQIGSGGGAPVGSITLQTNGTNNGSQQLLNLVNGSNITITDNGSGTITITGAGGSGPRSRNWRGWSSDGSDGLNPSAGFGCTPSSAASAFTGISPTATTPMALNIGTGASSNTLESFLADSDSHTADASICLGSLGIYETQMALGTTTHTRLWLGLANGVKSGANFWKSDTPPEPTIGFRYSTGASDANFQCVVTDGTTQLTSNSGVAATTAFHTFAIKFTNPNVLFYIDGNLVATIAISTTTLSVNSLFQGFFTIDNVANASNATASIVYNYWDSTV